MAARLRENIVWNLLGQGAVLALSVVAVRLIFVRLGGDVVGIVFFVLTLSPLLVSALDLGLSTTVVREVSQHHERDAEHVRALCRSVSTACWSLYVLGAGVLLLISPPLVSRWVHLTSLDPGTATTLLRLLGVGALTALPRAFYASVLRGLQRMRYTNVIDVATSLLQQGGMGVLLWRGADAVQAVAWMAGCFWLATAAYVLVTAWHLGRRAVLPGWSPAVVARIRRFSSGVFAISLLSVVSLQLDKLLVSKLLPIATFGVYSFIASLAWRPLVVSVAISLAAWPALSAGLKSGDLARRRVLYHGVQDLQCLLAVPALALPLYALAPIADYAFGGRVTESLLVPLGLLCVGFCVQVSIGTPSAMLTASGRPGMVAGASLLALAVSAPVGLVATSRFGMTGAALYWLLYSLVMCGYLVSRSARRFLGTTIADWGLRTGRVLGTGLLVFGPPLAIAVRLGGSAEQLAALYGLATTLFLLLWALGLLGDDVRSSVWRLWRQPDGGAPARSRGLADTPPVEDRRAIEVRVRSARHRTLRPPSMSSNGDPGPLTVLYVSGSGRSGTTLVGRILNEVDGCFDAGELRWLWSDWAGEASRGSCGCGRPHRECPVWSRVLGTPVAPGNGGGATLGARLPDLAASLRERFRIRHTWRLLNPARAAAAAPDFFLLGAIYRAIQGITGATVIVDTSKIPAGAAALLHMDGIVPVAVQMVRDPRAVAYSWLHPKGHLKRVGAGASAWNWLTLNLASEAVRRRLPGSSLLLRYEDLVADPPEAVGRLLGLAGLPPDRSPVRGCGVVLGGNHTVWGNPDRTVTGEVPILDDDRWRTGLPVHLAAGVTALTLPMLRRYGYPLTAYRRPTTRPRSASSESLGR